MRLSISCIVMQYVQQNNLEKVEQCVTFWPRDWDRLPLRNGSALWPYRRVCRRTRTMATIRRTRLKHFSCQRDYGRRKEERDFFGSDWTECLQAVVKFGGAREAGGEDIYGLG